MNIAERIARGADRAHQRRPWIAFPYAVVKKFGDDQAGNLAALVSYYGFFSLFPLMLVLVTVLGMLLQGNIELQERIESSALVNFPVIGDQISSNVHPLRGSGLALGIGIALSLWAGLGVLKVMQTAMNAVWNVPYRYRPNFVRSILKAAMMLGVLGVLTLASAAAGSVGAGSDNWLFGILGVAISLLLNFILFMLAFRIEYWNCASGLLSVTVTSLSAVASTLLTEAKKAASCEALALSMFHSIVKTTSSAVRGLPSWKVTPSRSVNT